jgi:ribonuclease E
MTKRMLIDATHVEETRVAVVDNNRLLEFDYESKVRKQLKGSIFLAKVTRVEPSLQAAFVNFGGNRHGFLPFSEIHPDYFRIPVADREALLAEQQAMLEALAAEEAAQIAAEEEALAALQAEGKTEEEALSVLEEQVRLNKPLGVVAPSEDKTEEAEDAARPSEEADIIADIPLSDEESEDESDDEDTEDDADEDEDEEGDDADESDETAQQDQDNESALIAAPQDSSAEGDEAAVASEQTELQEGEGEGQTRRRFRRGRGRDRGDRNGRRDGRGRGRGRHALRGRRSEMIGGEGVDSGSSFRFNPRKNYKIQEVIKRGQIMLVQVQKEERGNKGAAVTTYLSLPGRYSVLMPNSPRGGGVSRKIASFAERRRMREILSELAVPDGMSVILRTAGVSCGKDEIKRDLDYLMRLWDNVRELTLQSSAPSVIYEESNLVKRAVRDIYNAEIAEIFVSGEQAYQDAHHFISMLMPDQADTVKKYDDPKIPLFHRYQVENQIAEIGEPVVTLRSGGYLVINPTEALVSIDVNSGRATKERHIEETALKTNLEAAEEVARQLRLRDLGGLVVIDFIDMEDYRNNAKVERKLRDALSTDRARIQVGRISNFGLLELSRQRLNPSLTEAQFEKCAACAGVGHVRTPDSVAILALRALEDEGIRNRVSQVNLYLNPSVAIYMLNHKRDMMADIEQRYGFKVFVAVDDELTQGRFRIEGIKAVEPVARVERDDDAEDDLEDVDTAEAATEEAPRESNRGRHDKGRRNNRDRNDRPERGGRDAGRGRGRGRHNNLPRDEHGDVNGNVAVPEPVDTDEESGAVVQPAQTASKPSFQAKRFSARRSDPAPQSSEAIITTPASNDESVDTGPKKRGWWNKLIE